jgi:hypothetical protein
VGSEDSDEESNILSELMYGIHLVFYDVGDDTHCTSFCHTLRCAGGANEAHEVSTKAEDNLMLAAFWLRFPTRRSRPQKPDVRCNRCCSNPFSKKDLQKLVTSAVEKRLVKFEKTKPDDDASVKSDSLVDTPVGSPHELGFDQEEPLF